MSWLKHPKPNKFYNVLADYNSVKPTRLTRYFDALGVDLKQIRFYPVLTIAPETNQILSCPDYST